MRKEAIINFILHYRPEIFKSISCKLEKGTRTREEEEELVTAFVVNLLAECSELKYDYPKIPEEVVFDEVKAEKGWAELMSNKINYVLSEDVSPELIFPGAFIRIMMATKL